jgi:hypothetical protein
LKLSKPGMARFSFSPAMKLSMSGSVKGNFAAVGGDGAGYITVVDFVGYLSVGHRAAAYSLNKCPVWLIEQPDQAMRFVGRDIVVRERRCRERCPALDARQFDIVEAVYVPVHR